MRLGRLTRPSRIIPNQYAFRTASLLARRTDSDFSHTILYQGRFCVLKNTVLGHPCWAYDPQMGDWVPCMCRQETTGFRIVPDSEPEIAYANRKNSKDFKIFQREAPIDLTGINDGYGPFHAEKMPTIAGFNAQEVLN